MDLQPLLAIFSRGSLLSPETAVETAKLIFECFTLHIDPNKLDECLVQIFSDDNGVHNFLLDKLTVKSFNSSKEQILKLFKFILENEQKHKGWEARVFPFIHHFMDVAKLYWRNSSEPAKHQQLALESLIIIFENYADQVDLTKVPELYWDLLKSSETSKFQPSVRGKMFHTLGMIAALTHTRFFNRDDYFQQLYEHICRTIKGQVESTDAHLEVAIVHGCLKAMDKLLQFFCFKMNKNGIFWKQFYENLTALVDPQCSIVNDARSAQVRLKRREFQRAGLELIANNGPLFSKELFNHHQRWYTDLMHWSKSSNSNDSTVGKRAIFSFLKAVFSYASTTTARGVGRDEMEADDVLDRFVSYFIKAFEDILGLESPRRNETIVAVTGIGLLSPLCRNASKVTLIAERIFDNVGKIILELKNPIADKYSNSLSILSTYLETISNLLIHAIQEDKEEDDGTETEQPNESNLKFLNHLHQIEQLVILFLTSYPQLSVYHKKTAHNCFLKIVSALHSKHARHCIPFTDRTITIVLSQIIASPTSAELEILEDAWRSNNEEEEKQQSVEDGSSATTSATTIPTTSSQPKKYPIQLRGVSSFMGIWTNITNSKSEPVASKLIFDRIMSWSLSTMDKLDLTMKSKPNNDDDDDNQQEQHPSDIYSSMIAEKPKDFQLFINLIEFLQKLLHETSDQQVMFDNWVAEFVTKIVDHSVKNPLVSGFYKILGTTLGITSKLDYFEKSHVENVDLKEKCSIFMKSIMLKIDTFRDDLLISVLELWLSIPDEILIENISSWCLTLQKIFKMGQMCLPLADKSIDALQRWMTVDCIPREAIEDIVVKLFPLWHSYFLTEGKRASQVPHHSQPKSKSKKKVKLEEMELIRANVEDEELLRKVQVKILKVIGSFAHVIDLAEDGQSVDISLEQNYNILKCNIPFGRDGLEIYLDYICPRVIQLCENSGANRQVRVAACEFLHTAFLYFLGYSVKSNMTGQQSIDLFKQMFKIVIKLSGDFDFLIRQLFNPLASQSIHWYSSEKTPYSDAILEILVDGLVSDDSQLKDFSADCLYEFFKWALKHGNKKLTRDVIKLTMALSSHANAKYRLGASIAFNSIYRDFREDYELANSYTIILITGFLTSLSISRGAEEDSSIIKSTQASISHLTRIIVKKKDNFNNSIGKRKKPPGFGMGDTVQLRDLSNWLILQLGKPERIFRKECSTLLSEIAPLVRGAAGGSVEAFLNSSCNHDIKTLIQAAEHQKPRNIFSIEDLLSFLDSATEFYTFFHNHNSLSPLLLQNPESTLFSSAIKLFQLQPPYCDLEQQQQEQKDLKRIARISVRLNQLEGFFPNDAERQKYYEFVITASKTMTNPVDMFNLIQILVQSKSKLCPSILAQLNLQCSQHEIEKIITTSLLPSPKNKSIVLSLRWLRLAADNQLFEISGEDAERIADIILNDLLRKLYGTTTSSEGLSGSSGVNSTTQLTQEVVTISSTSGEEELNELLKLSLAFGINYNKLLDVIFDSQPFQVNNNNSSSSGSSGGGSKNIQLGIPITKGEHFQKLLASGLFHPILLDFRKLSMSIKIEMIGSYIEFLLKTIRSNKSLRQNYGQLLFENIIKIWAPISVNCDKYTVARILSCLTWLNFEACRDSVQLCHWWCGKDVMGGGLNLDMAELTEFIGFLGLFGLSSDSKIVDSVINVTEKVVQNNFPTSSAAASHHESITKLVTQILGVFERSPKNVKMLELLSLCVLKLSAFPDGGAEMNFIFKEMFRRFLKLSQSGTEQEVVLEAASCLLRLILNGKDYQNNRNLFLYCLRPLVLGMPKTTFKIFFKRKIKLMLDSLLNSTKDSSSSTPSIFQLNVDRIIYNLISMVPKRHGQKFLEELTTEYKQRQGEEGGVPESNRMTIVKVVSTAFLQIKRRKTSAPCSYDANSMCVKLHETLLGCHGSAYNALSSLLVVSQNQPNLQRLVEGMLIHEDRSKTFLWENLVDCSPNGIQNYFPVLLESNEPTTDDDLHEDSAAEDPTQFMDKNINTTTAKQFANARINLAQSSLSGDAGGGGEITFDFTTKSNVEMSETPFYEGFILSQSRANIDSSLSDNAYYKTLQLEYKCAAFSEESIEGLASTIKKLITLCNPATLEVQKWMEYLRDVLTGSHHENIKIFILTAMLNCQKELMPYGNMFIGPICKLITENQTWDEPLNYFVKDVLVMLLDWKEAAIIPGNIPGTNDPRPDMCCHIILNIMAQNVKYSRNDLLETNLNLLETVVRLWEIQSAHLSTLTQTGIFTELTCDTPKVAILICKSLLKNNIIPVEDPRELLRQFCKLLKNFSKPIYSESAACIGLLFKFLKNVNCPLDQATESLVEKLKAEKSRPLPFLIILSQIQKNYPEIMSYFHDELLEMLGKTSSTTGSGFDIVNILFSSLLLQIQSSSSSSAFDPEVQISTFISDLNGRNIFNTPCTIEDAPLGISIFEEFVKYPNAYADSSSQLCMKMVSWLNNVVIQQQQEQLRGGKGVEATTTSNNTLLLQARYYKCILEIYFHCSSLDESDKMRIFEIFNNALKYEELELRIIVDEFWKSALEDCQTPAELFIKLVQLFGEGSNSLEIILGRILQRCSLAPEFQKTIFDKPLEDCIFYDYNLDTSWRTRQASFLPLFAESISSQQFSTIPQSLQASIMRQRLSVPQFGVNLLRASLSLRQQQFSPTVVHQQQQRGTREFVTFSDFDRMDIDDDDDDHHQQQQQATQQQQNTANSNLRKRFYNRPMESATYFATRQRNLNAAKLSAMKNKLQSKQNLRVTRKYRIGEIPDILIKHADLLTTLVKLGQCDADCGRLLVSQIFSKVLDNSNNNETGLVLDNILQNTKISKVLAATIMDISIRNKFTISPNSTTSICTRHNLHELSIILLENRLIKLETQPFELEGGGEGEQQLSSSSLPKRRRIETTLTSFDTMRESIFLNIVELYSDLQEVDVLKNIFLQLSSSSEKNSKRQNFSTALNALNLESNGKLEEAVENYAELFHENVEIVNNSNGNNNESYWHFIESSYFECLSKLSEWKQLMEIVGPSILIIDESTTSGPNRIHSRRQSLAARTGLIMTLEGQSHSCLSDLNVFVQQLDTPDDPQFYLERALILIANNSYENANKGTLLLEQYLSKGITDFVNFTNLSLPQKNETMLQYQLASTLNDILIWQKNLDSGNVQHKTRQLLSKFGKLIGNGGADLYNSGLLTSARSFFVNKLLHHDLLVENEELSKKMSLTNFQQHLWMLSLGVRDQILAMSNKYLDSSKILGDDVSSLEFLAWRKAYIRYLNCFRTSISQDDWGLMWASGWKKIKTGSSAAQEIEPYEIIEMKSGLLRCLAASLSDNETSNFSYKSINKVLDIGSKSSITDAVEVGCRELFDLVNQQQQQTEETTSSSMQLYQLMEELLRRFPETYATNFSSLKLLLESLLRSISSDENDEAVLLFPRLLDFTKQHPQLHTTFLAMSSIVPTWKFLPWLDQIMTTYECDPIMQKILEPILHRIITEYPDSLRLQYDNFLPSNQKQHADYVTSLKALVLPTILHKTSIDEMLSNIKEKNLKGVRDTMIKFGKNLQEILDCKDIYGSLHLQFAQEILGIFIHHLNLTDQEFMKQSEQTQDFLVQLKKGIEAIKMSHEKRIFTDGRSSIKIKELKEFSPWLAKFHHFQSHETIKFPGLFDQLSKPDIGSHPTIVSFNPTVQVYHSLTFPIRITILGNDGKRRNFLTKYGDDLRQDRRIQQLFRVANNFFANNSQTRQRKINIVTYSVTPITSSFGIIEWLDKTSKLSSFILNTKQLEAQQNAAANSHQEWLERTSGLKSPPSPLYHVYAGAAKKGTRQNAEAHFNVLSNTTPTSLLSEHLMERCRSYEQFFKVRQNFIRSYSAMCLVHWLLGIGDRHLQNSLLSLETGKVIGIDFGRVFEVTNNGQPIPEMIPFRLTPNFTNLMMPYGYKGLFRETMCISWRCLLEWSNTILFIINTFVNEQNIKWTTATRKGKIALENGQQQGGGGEVGGVAENVEQPLVEWAPLQIIKRKLLCENPIQILLDTLETNPWKEIIPIYCDIIKNGRQKVLDKNKMVLLTQEQVIDCLLDMATDKNILARLYVGLLSWI